MKQLLTTNIQTFNTNSFLLNKSIEDMSDDQLYARPNDKVNPIQFILGHLTIYRNNMCTLLGDEKEYPFTDLYKMKATVQDASVYPTIAELKAEWENKTQILMPLLEKVTEEKLAETIEAKYPIGEQNVLGALSFCAYHESYHIGQIAYIRKYLGYETLIG